MANSRRYDDLSDDQLRAVDAACETFEQSLRNKTPVLIESQLEGVPAAIKSAVFRELLAVELEWRIAHDQVAGISEYLARFPAHHEDVRQVFSEAGRLAPRPSGESLSFARDTGMTADDHGTEHLQRIGRYKLEKLVGTGSFGLVYRAHDEQLDRVVAIKVPHDTLLTRRADLAACLAEAQTVAGLDHPHIVPVYDFGSSDEVPCYIVSKYVDGSSLSARLKEGRLHYRAAVKLVAAVAEALHAAHRQGLVHRDVKPGNILIDRGGQAYLTDFGLALGDENIGRGPRYAGTPSYMSPEQARGEEHRVDGRSDIFSLGVVLYELLVGRQPFRAATQAELLQRVATYEPRPPRQYDDQIPRGLERICLKALSKRACDRYATAHEMAESLLQLLEDEPVTQASAAVGAPGAWAVPVAPDGTASGTTSTGGTSSGVGSPDYPLKVVPRGLLSFDEHDTEFFLDLLPGPRDRTGLPESVGFWKARIEERDADKTFSVGLIYGPSGSGKSSLVKAGLLPRLSRDVVVVYVEATGTDTETRLLSGIRKRFPELANDLGLARTLIAVRREEPGTTGKKLLIVLDQFEQWLHSKRAEHDPELVQALRQCDGSRVQCIVTVRDDFWLAVSRFVRDLEVDLIPGRNVALVDLFELDHARVVLAAFGRAFGQLAGNVNDTTKPRRDFLTQALLGLAEGGKVVPVRLSLFAEMMKGKRWTTGALKEIGGTAGVGVAFLEEAFSARAAVPTHRLHQRAARRVLEVLLPETEIDIKGHMRSQDELLQASGYADRMKDFVELLHILDGELRLITPTDPEGSTTDDVPHARALSPKARTGRFYQLTHDYIVPSLREWLTRKKKETRRGRAELLIADRAAVWSIRRDNRQLPSLLQWLQIKCLTRQSYWTPPQRQMMKKAGRVHLVRWASGLLVVLGIAIVIQQLMPGRSAPPQGASPNRGGIDGK